jgi:hypothetical protein
MADQNEEMEKILGRMHALEVRLKKLEEALLSTGDVKNFAEENSYSAEESRIITEINNEEEKGLESQIGRFGLAWLGNIVLLVGITFLSQYLMNLGYGLISILLGYLSAAAIFYMGYYLVRSNSHLSFIFRINALVLFFYITVRLHFFTVDPLIQQKTISVLILILFLAFQFTLSVRNRSQVYAALAVVFAFCTAALADSTYITLSMVLITSAGAVFFYSRYSWEPLLMITIFLSYIVFLLWLFGNPLSGHPVQMISVPQGGVFFLLAIGTSFSITALFRKKDSVSDDFLISSIIINGILFTLILLLMVLRFYPANYVPLFAGLTLFALVFSIILHSKSDWNFASAFYALYGFMSMSIALYGIIGFPGVYLLLPLQSLVVVSMALWFRNRLIVVMNSLLFLSILIIYLLSSKNVSGPDFCFAVVALVSARIINWKSSRLYIKTDLIRNLYMMEGFVMMLLALLHSVPRQFVTFSWTMAALLYFVISLLLKNIKYRYMALGTMICAAIYLFIIDLARIEIIYRVLALLFLATISIGISIYYTNRIKKAE